MLNHQKLDFLLNLIKILESNLFTNTYMGEINLKIHFTILIVVNWKGLLRKSFPYPEIYSLWTYSSRFCNLDYNQDLSRLNLFYRIDSCAFKI